MSLVTEIIKQGFLKKITSGTFLNPAKKSKLRWFVFGKGSDGSKFYLEYYPCQEANRSNFPINSFDLTACTSVTENILQNDEDGLFLFVIALADRSITLAAPTQHDMIQWLSVFQSNLKLKSRNYYTTDAPLGYQPNLDKPLPPVPTSNVCNRDCEGLSDGSLNGNILDLQNEDKEDFYEKIVMEKVIDTSDNSGNVGVLLGNPMTSLKEIEYQTLVKEIQHEHGVSLSVLWADCYNSIAFVEYDSAVFIAGWNVKDYPRLHGLFHLGDQLISINGIKVINRLHVQTLVKNSDINSELLLLIKRLPFANVILLHRHENFEPLGFERKYNTGEIIEIIPNSMIDKYGVKVMTPTPGYHNLCHWYITEINNRPLSFFAKEKAIQKRLSAIGLDLTLVVQPAIFVYALIKAFKNLKNYKKFIPSS